MNDRSIIESGREPLPMPVTGIILCGGRSRRMGRPKPFLPYEGTTIIQHILDKVRDLFQEILLVANEPDQYENYGVDVVKDILPFRGPLGGILSGLLTSAHHHSFVVACDMPLVDRKLIRQMTAERHGTDALVLTHDQGVEPLFGLYSKNCIKPLEESLFAGNLSLHDFLSGLQAKAYPYENENESSLPSFFNINTPQDYSRLIVGAPAAEVHPFPGRRQAI